MVAGEIKKSSRAAIPGKGWWLLAIMVLAFTLRVIFMVQARSHLFFNAFSDSLYYHQWALRLVGGLHGPPVFYMGPLYPYLLAGFYTLFGPYSELVLWFHILLGTASCYLIYLLGRMVFDRTVGLLAAAMGALYAPDIFYEGALLMTVLLSFLNLSLLVSLHWALRRRKWPLWIVPGLFLGLSALGRANILAFLPLLIGGIFLLRRGFQGGGVIRWPAATAAMIIGVVLVLTPVAIQNVMRGGDLVLITSNLGLNFFVGNNPDASGYYEKPKGLDLATDLYGAKIAGVHMGRGLKPSEVSRFWLKKALVFVRSRPGAFLKLTADKVLFFWNAYEIPQVENLEFFKQFAPLLRWPLVSFSVLGPLGILGMALSLRRWREVYFLLAFVGALMAATVVFFVISRLRLQVCPVLMVFAGYALTWLRNRLCERNIRGLILAALGLAVAVVFVNWPLAALDRATHMAQAHRFLALHLRNGDRLDQASQEYERAIAIDPQLADTYVDLATLRIDQGRPAEGLELYQKALLVDSLVSGVHLNLGNMYAQLGKWDEAVAEFRAEVRASPYSLKAYEVLYRALQEQKKQGKTMPSEKS